MNPAPIPAAAGGGRTLALLCAVFVAALLPFLASFVPYCPDERHYTDGALVMLRTGDCWTPRAADGTPRFAKPVAAYWAVAAGCKLLGVGPLGARLPSAASAVGVLVLAYLLGRRLGGRDDAGLLAVLMIMSEPFFFTTAMRSMPDIHLMFAMTLSYYGLFGLLASDRFRPADAAAFYLGAGLAVATKGLLGVLFVAFGWAALAYWRPAHLRGRALAWHAPLLLAAAALGGGWFAAMRLLHGPGWSDPFLKDQIEQRVTMGFVWRRPLNVLAYALLVPALFAPWAAALAWFRRRPGAGRRAFFDEPVTRAILFWTLLNCLVFGLAPNIRPRYLLPVFAPVAALLAARLCAALPAARALPLRTFLRIMLAVAVALALATVAACRGVPQSLWRPLTALALTAALTWRLVGRIRGSGWVPSLAAAMSGLFWLLPAAALLLHARMADTFEQRLAQLLRQPDGRYAEPALLPGGPQSAARFRMFAGQPLRTVLERDLRDGRIPDAVQTVVLAPEDAARFDLSAFDLHRAMLPFLSFHHNDTEREPLIADWRDVLDFVRHGTPATAYVVGFREPAASSLSDLDCCP